MYLQHFGLSDYPFSLTPDTALYFPWAAPHETLHAIHFALGRGDGLLKVTGEVGSGKTLLSRLLLQEMEEQGWATAYLNVPLVDTQRLPLEVAREFGIAVSDPTEAYRALCAYLLDLAAAGRQAVLVVDEAQALGSAGLETIRLLSNLETDKRKLLPIVLFGQPELDALLSQHALRQVAQRIAFSFATRPLPPALVADYVRHRLQQCGADTRQVGFEPAAIRALATSSRGLVRLLHLLADKALLAAYSAGARRVSAAHVRRAVRELPQMDLRGVRWWQRLWRRAA